MIAWFKSLKLEPAIVLYLLNAGLAVGVSFGVDLSHTQQAAILTIATGVFTIVAAARTRPANVSLITATFATGLTAAATFGLHVNADRIGVLTALLSGILGLVLRVHVSPVVGTPAKVRHVAS
jgi:hypothetical protein